MCFWREAIANERNPIEPPLSVMALGRFRGKVLNVYWVASQLSLSVPIPQVGGNYDYFPKNQILRYWPKVLKY